MDIHGVVTTELVYSGLTGLTDWPLLATQTQCSAVHWNANAGGIRGWGVNSLVSSFLSSRLPSQWLLFASLNCWALRSLCYQERRVVSVAVSVGGVAFRFFLY